MNTKPFSSLAGTTGSAGTANLNAQGAKVIVTDAILKLLLPLKRLSAAWSSFPPDPVIWLPPRRWVGDQNICGSFDGAFLDAA